MARVTPRPRQHPHRGASIEQGAYDIGPNKTCCTSHQGCHTNDLHCTQGLFTPPPFTPALALPRRGGGNPLEPEYHAPWLRRRKKCWSQRCKWRPATWDAHHQCGSCSKSHGRQARQPTRWSGRKEPSAVVQVATGREIFSCEVSKIVRKTAKGICLWAAIWPTLYDSISTASAPEYCPSACLAAACATTAAVLSSVPV